MCKGGAPLLDGGITVVVPCYNASRFIVECVQSVISQEKNGFFVELIIVDDGSTDESISLLEPFKEQCKLVAQSNRGACVARNLGLSLASYTLVKFLDADDYLATNVLSRQYDQIRSIPGRSVSVFGDVVTVDETGRAVAQPQMSTSSGNLTRKQCLSGITLTASPLHWTERVRAIGGFDTQVPRGQEQDLHTRLWLSGVDFKHFEGTTYYYRQHPGPRISSRDGDTDILAGRYKAFCRQISLAKARFGDELPPDVCDAFAELLWGTARLGLRKGAHREDVLPFFIQASAMSNGRVVVGSLVYRLIVFVFGPILAERFLTMLKRILMVLRHSNVASPSNYRPR
ncbi:glycosyltransferase family 2 protein [Planctomycetaceae bacterium SH139]